MSLSGLVDRDNVPLADHPTQEVPASAMVMDEGLAGGFHTVPAPGYRFIALGARVLVAANEASPHHLDPGDQRRMHGKLELVADLSMRGVHAVRTTQLEQGQAPGRRQALADHSTDRHCARVVLPPRCCNMLQRYELHLR